jgi:hypothetical protein
VKIRTNDWHKSFHDRELVEANSLTAEERGCYYTVRNLIFKELGHVLNDDAFLAGWCRVKPGRFAIVKAKLLKLGVLYVDGTSLRSRTADSIIAERMAKRQKARKSGQMGGRARAEAKRTKPDRARKRTRNADSAPEQEPDRQLFEEPTASSNRLNGPEPESGSTTGKIRSSSPAVLSSTGRGQAPQPIEKPGNGLSERYPNATNSLAESKNQESKKAEEEEKEDSVVDGADDLTADAVEEATAIYNDVAGDNNDWPKVKTLHPKRKRLLGKLLNTEGTGGLDGWRAMLKRASESDWLAGRVNRGRDHSNWRASLDYFARLDVFVEVTEGRHDNRGTPNRSGKRDGAEAMGEALGRFLEDDSS